MRDIPTAEFLLEMGELAVDMITTTDVVKEFPVVGSAFKAVKAMDDVRSHLLARKIDRFLSEPNLVTTVAARRARGRIVEDDDHARQVGETLLMVLDKVTDFDKPVLLAKVYAGYLDGAVERDMLLLIVHAIDISSSVDLQRFIDEVLGMASEPVGWKERLVHAGLFKLGYHTVQFGGTASTSPTAIGDTLRRVIQRYP